MYGREKGGIFFRRRRKEIRACDWLSSASLNSIYHLSLGTMGTIIRNDWEWLWTVRHNTYLPSTRSIVVHASLPPSIHLFLPPSLHPPLTIPHHDHTITLAVFFTCRRHDRVRSKSNQKRLVDKISMNGTRRTVWNEIYYSRGTMEWRAGMGIDGAVSLYIPLYKV